MNTEISQDFLKHPKNFKSYKWYKPILVMLLTSLFFFVLSNVLTLAVSFIEMARGNNIQEIIESMKGGYDSFNTYSLSGALLSLGNLALLIPSLIFASLIVGDRPFSSYSSSKGGWRMGVFVKCFLICLIVSAVPVAIYTFITNEDDNIRKFSIAGLITCTLLCPFQCIAEEYIFRSLITQTITSWFRVRIIAVIVSSLIFMMFHPYNGIGKIEILCTGAAMCIMAWIGRGIEASSAIHITNNMTIFYLSGFGIGKVQTDETIGGVILTIVVDIVYIAVLYFVQKKFHWFDAVKKDDVTPFNEAYEKKLESKNKKPANK